MLWSLPAPNALARMALEMHGCAAACLPPVDSRKLVLLASRMESHGVPGQVQITRATWELLRDDFVCEPRGLVDVKGPVETWTLVGPRS